MRILMACILYPVASGRYMYDAFKRLGHDVRVVGDSTGNRIWATELDPKWAWESDGPITAYWPDWTPDLVILMDSAFAYHSPMYPDVPHVVYGVDNHVRKYDQYGMARYFLGHKGPSLMDVSRPDVEWLPCAYDPHWFTPSPIPWAERQYDVALVGFPYSHRVKLVMHLQQAGLNVFAGVGPVYDEYRDLYHNTRVSLCISAAQDVAQRIFETAAMGCAVLSDPLPDLKALDAKGITVFESPDEVVDLARKLQTTGEKLALAGQKWAAPHTWDARAQRIVGWWQETYAPKPKAKTDKAESNND